MKAMINKLSRADRNIVILIMTFMTISPYAESQYLKRSLSEIPEAKTALTTPSAHYKPLFGEGDNNSDIIRGISRYGNLILDPGGKSNSVKYENEEQIVFVLGGTGILNFEKKEVPVSANDFIYIPEGRKFSFANPRERPLSLIVMGFKLSPDTCKFKTSDLMIANCDEVQFQTLPSHGPTTTFQLLLGTVESTRDRLAAACQVTSLFIMDFAAGGTNNPHNHAKEEEIYLVLRGTGDIVAGRKDDGTELRHPASEGDVYFYSPKTLIGFYSGNKENEEHPRILAVRFKYPSK